MSTNEARKAVLRSINSNNAEQTVSILNDITKHQASITIRVHAMKMEQLSQDTHYRNIFVLQNQ